MCAAPSTHPAQGAQKEAGGKGGRGLSAGFLLEGTHGISALLNTL